MILMWTAKTLKNWHEIQNDLIQRQTRVTILNYHNFHMASVEFRKFWVENIFYCILYALYKDPKLPFIVPFDITIFGIQRYQYTNVPLVLFVNQKLMLDLILALDQLWNYLLISFLFLTALISDRNTSGWVRLVGFFIHGKILTGIGHEALNQNLTLVNLTQLSECLRIQASKF